MSARIAPAAPAMPWATPVGELALAPDVVWRAGFGAMLALVGPRDLPRTLVHSWWAPVRLRTELAGAAVKLETAHLPLRLALLALWLAPRPARVWPLEGGERAEEYIWPRARYR